MGAADPTYPFYPIVCVAAAGVVFLVLLTSFIRQNWNLGVTFLCFWIFLENVIQATNAIIWSDNASIERYVYCDIVSHLFMITYIVKPMATLIITRRLYMIASLQSVNLPSKSARRRNSLIEWTLGLFVPLMVAGPLYYAHQGTRFEVDEGFGCTNDVGISILELLTIDSWTIIPPLVSVLFYYPKVIRIFYQQSRDIHSFLKSGTSISRTSYLRILVLASIDILLTLPFGIVSIVLSIISFHAEHILPFYLGWTFLHTDWEPVSVSYAQIKAFGTTNIAELYFARWTSPVLAFAIFGLFGLTLDARASYCRVICTVGCWFGWDQSARSRNTRGSLGDIQFSAQLQEQALGDIEMASCRPNLVSPEALNAVRHPEHRPSESVPREFESESGSNSESIKEVR